MSTTDRRLEMESSDAAVEDPAPTPSPLATTRPVTPLERVLFGLSAAGVPIGIVVPRLMGRLGGLLVEVAAAALWVRAVAMIVAGTPARLRVTPRLLLFAEGAVDGLAVVTGFWAWVWRPFLRPRLLERAGKGAQHRRPRRRHLPARDKSEQRMTAAAAAAWTMALVVHTIRMAIYISPGRGLRTNGAANRQRIRDRCVRGRAWTETPV